MNYECILDKINNEGIHLIEFSFKGIIKGLYSDNTIAISKNLYNDTEKKCILAEELGHYYTSYGEILNMKDVKAKKQELIARKWAYENLISINNLIDAFNNGINGRYELAMYLSVTEEFLQECIDYYESKYGQYFKSNNYIITFNPLTIFKSTK